MGILSAVQGSATEISDGRRVSVTEVSLSLPYEAYPRSRPAHALNLSTSVKVP